MINLLRELPRERNNLVGILIDFSLTITSHFVKVRMKFICKTGMFGNIP